MIDPLTTGIALPARRRGRGPKPAPARPPAKPKRRRRPVQLSFIFVDGFAARELQATTTEGTMPSKSKKQARTMRAAAHDPAFAKKLDIKQSVAGDFVAADAKAKRKGGKGGKGGKGRPRP